MIVLKCEFQLKPEHKAKLREEIKKKTGEDCIILEYGLDLVQVQTKKEQPLWRRLFQRA